MDEGIKEFYDNVALIIDTGSGLGEWYLMKARIGGVHRPRHTLLNDSSNVGGCEP